MDLAQFATPYFSRLPLEYVFAALKEQQTRQDREELWRSYMALIIPMWGSKETETFEELLEKQERRRHVVTREELDEADRVARETAAAFGLL